MSTYLQGMAYELARELISSRIGSLSSEIGAEERKPNPSHSQIEELEAQIISLAREREALDPQNASCVRDAIIRYSRTGKVPDELLG